MPVSPSRILLSLLLAALLQAPTARASGAEERGGPIERSRSCRQLARAIERHERGLPERAVAPGFRLFEVRRRSHLARLEQRYTDRCLDLTQLQSIGSHNSYHQMPRPRLFQLLLAFDPVLFLAWEYEHAPLPEQLELEQVRQLELDVFADPIGGLYAMRPALALLGDDPIADDPRLFEPGMKVLHVQDLDFETRCPRLLDCLRDVKRWSDEHPRHLPVAVLLELKDDPIPDPLQLGFVVPVPFGTAELDDLDAEIRSVFPPEQLLTPDDVRVPGFSLEESVLNDGWPLLGESRGRILFLMDNGGAMRAAYLAGHPNLEGRVLFTNGVPGEPDAAFVKRNDPIGSFLEIQDLVRAGYLVRTRADSDTIQARTGDTTRRDAALASGAHFVSTDYASPDMRFGTGYQVTLPGGGPAQCNPLTAPPGCRDAALEPGGDLERGRPRIELPISEEGLRRAAVVRGRRGRETPRARLARR